MPLADFCAANVLSGEEWDYKHMKQQLLWLNRNRQYQFGFNMHSIITHLKRKRFFIVTLHISVSPLPLLRSYIFMPFFISCLFFPHKSSLQLILDPWAMLDSIKNERIDNQPWKRACIRSLLLFICSSLLLLLTLVDLSRMRPQSIFRNLASASLNTIISPNGCPGFLRKALNCLGLMYDLLVGKVRFTNSQKNETSLPKSSFFCRFCRQAFIASPSSR